MILFELTPIWRDTSTKIVFGQLNQTANMILQMKKKMMYLSDCFKIKKTQIKMKMYL